MKVLLTGAFGNIGTNTLRELVKGGHEVTCFDLRTRRTLKVWKRFKRFYQTKVKVLWGDIRRREDVAAAIDGADVVLHLAAIIPPVSERNPGLAEKVNVEGTENLIQAARAQAKPPKIVYTSSYAVFGPRLADPPPRIVTDPLVPTDNYSRHKIVCEKMIRESGLTWSVLRCPAMPSLDTMGADPIMFDISLDTRIEILDPRDAGLAVANSVSADEVWGKILLLGGGQSCQFTYCEYVGRTLDAVGIGRLPCEAYGKEPAYFDWVDTSESERILSYQRYSLADYLREFVANLGWKRYFIPLLRRLIRYSLLRNSPYLPPGSLGGRKRDEYWKDRIALVTGASSGIGATTARLLAGKGLRVALVARRAERLEQVAKMIREAGGEAMVLNCDLADSIERVRVIEEITSRWGKIDILVNNAGLAWYGYGADMPWDVAEKMIKVNVTALTHLTMMVLRRMRSMDSGHVINVSSIAGSFPQQGIMVYGATKSFTDSLSTSLYREMKGTNVHVSCVKPGAVSTDMYRTAEKLPGGRRVPAEGLAVSVERVAKRIWRLLNRPQRRAYVPGLLWFVPWVEAYFGWMIDLLGPVLLRRATSVVHSHKA